MPKSAESINDDLDGLLSSHGFDVTTMDSSGKEVPIPSEADLFQFHFHKDGEDYGTVTVTIDGLQKMIIYYNDQVAKSGQSASGEDISWIDLVKQFKKFAQAHQLAFELKDTDRLRTDMKRREHTKRLEESVQLDEGYYGNKKMSYSDDTPSVKMVIKHNKQLEETDQRFRHIDSIFLETSDGERFKAPTTKPSQARMFARHVAEGGAYQDDRWSHLKEICEDVETLSGFCRATHNKREQFNESTQRMINEAQAQYQNLRESIKKLSTSRGYNKYFESYSPAVITETDTGLAEAFKTSSLDNRIERALPVLSKFGIKHTEISESSMFEDWADSILESALDPMTDRQEEALLKVLNDKELKVGPNAEVAIGELNDIIDNDTLNNELRIAARQDSNNDAVAVIKSWMERQHNPRYDEILDELESGSEEEVKPSNIEPAKVQPKEEPQSQQEPEADAGESDLPPLPPLAEDSDFKRMLKLSGL